MSKFMIGADPELFMVDAAGAFVSAIGRIGGSKQYPQPLLELGEGFAVQEDNVAVEYNIPASASRDEFINNIDKAQAFLSQMVAKQGLRFINISATNEWSAEDLAHPQAMEFGCEPDFDAWRKGKVNPRPKATDSALRTAGGHVHIGYQFTDKAELLRCVRLCDLMLSVPATIMDHGETRKELYGKRGAFRPKPYGVEYRSLSNFWVEGYAGWVYDQVARVVDALQQGVDVLDDDELIRQAINENNKTAAIELIGKHNLMVV